MKKLMLLLRLTRKLILWLLSPIILYVLSAVVLSVLTTHPRKADCAVHQKIYLSTNGVHLDIILSVEKTDPHFLQKLNISSEYRFVAFGWGDKQFYINTPKWSDLTFKTACTALFLKSESAMHVTGYTALNAHWHEIVLCPEQMDNLNSYIQNSFSKDNDGNLYKLDISGYYNDDSFYDATESFSLFKTCNIWVNRALKVAEIKTSVWSPFDKGILMHIKN